ncbi:MAG: peptide chain release factor N(5)-glutamine methyltransferase [Alphaproteobacteria bacterium]
MENSLQEILNKLKDGGVSAPRLEVSMLVEFVGQGKDFIAFTSEEKDTLFELIEKRLRGMPVCKMIGSKGFYKYDFIVSEDVLSPRPDTEILVEKAIDILKQEKLNTPKVLELGLGSGCVLLSILSEFDDISGVGLELSEKAIAIAQKNVHLLEQTKKTQIVEGSWFDENLAEKLSNQTFDIVVSNPPYIPSQDILSLDVEVKNFDPLSALDGGEDGLRDYRKIAEVSKSILKNGGHILLEVGINQADAVVKIFENQRFELIEKAKDLSGIERCIIFKK